MRQVIHRIEHPSHRCGPYWKNRVHSSRVQVIFFDHNFGHLRHTRVAPHRAGGPPITRDLGCGFLTRADAAYWFEGFINALACDGFVLATYSAEVVWTDLSQDRARQLLYKRASALLLSEERLK